MASNNTPFNAVPAFVSTAILVATWLPLSSQSQALTRSRRTTAKAEGQVGLIDGN